MAQLSKQFFMLGKLFWVSLINLIICEAQGSMGMRFSTCNWISHANSTATVESSSHPSSEAVWLWDSRESKGKLQELLSYGTSQKAFQKACPCYGTAGKPTSPTGKSGVGWIPMGGQTGGKVNSIFPFFLSTLTPFSIHAAHTPCLWIGPRNRHPSCKIIFIIAPTNSYLSNQFLRPYNWWEYIVFLHCHFSLSSHIAHQKARENIACRPRKL